MGGLGMDYVTFFRNSEKTIRDLQSRVDETFKERNSAKGRERWSQACSEFHARYDKLAFPGGYNDGLERLRNSEKDAIEAALVFLEMHPYFFRSGYMRTKLMRALKHVTLSGEDAMRLETVIEEQRKRRAINKTGSQE